tara:strand:- start:314 stop:964 length:651 start_codon:yes stop_codon:yes gene_type:complete
VAVILTVDVVLLTLRGDELHVALFKRAREPFRGLWALPGGFIREAEDDSAKAAAARVLRDKTGLVPPYLEEFGTVSGPARDPRGWSLTVVYFALVPAALLDGQPDTFAVSRLPNLPFDHAAVIAQVVERVRNKASYSSLPVFLCDPEFTIPELHAAYEAVQGEQVNAANFRRKLEEMGVLEEIKGQTKVSGRNRPAQLYRVAKPFRDRLSVRPRGL